MPKMCYHKVSLEFHINNIYKYFVDQKPVIHHYLPTQYRLKLNGYQTQSDW